MTVVDVLAIGGITVDRKYHLPAPAVLGSSNPAAGVVTRGGVARNVAVNLALMGHAVRFGSVIGDDEAGRDAMVDLASFDVEARLKAVPGARTAEYVAVLDPSGELVIGLADMAILDAHLPEIVRPLVTEMPAPKWIFADCNLPTDALAALFAARQDASWCLAIGAVSVRKATRLPDDLTGIDLLVLNQAEAEAVAGPGAPQDQARRLLARGAAEVVVTLGPAGIVVATAAATIHQSARPARVVDVTGAGDAFLAGLLSARLGGRAGASAAEKGLAAAAATIESPESVRPDIGAVLAAEAFA